MHTQLEEVAPTFQSLLKDTNVEFLQREIEGVDVENSMVYLSKQLPPSSSTLTSTKERRRQEGTSYDALVIATGADINLSAIPGAESYALPFYTVEDCFELRRTLALYKSVATVVDPNNDTDTDRVVNVVVVGGGYSGVELALNVSERLKRSYSKVHVTIVHRGDEVLQYATEYNRKTGVDRLKKAGVTLKTGSSVVDVTPLHDADDEMDTKFSSEYLTQKRCRVNINQKMKSNNAITIPDAPDALDADLLLWTAGASSTNIPKGVLNSILPRDSNGRVVTDSLLCTRPNGYERDSNVFALGDRARVAQRKPYGATAQVAIQQATVVSWNIYASLLNDNDSAMNTNNSESQQSLDLLPFSYLDLGEMLTLGEEDASITSLDGLVRLDGAGASVLRRLIYAVRMPTAQQALSAALLGAEKRVESLVAKQRLRQNNVSMKKKKMSWK